MIKILFCGDVVGKSGRKILNDCLPRVKELLDLDVVIVNGENAAHGFGISPRIYADFMRMGVQVITLGNHAFDKADIFPVLAEQNNIIRPLNFPENTIGKGACVYETAAGVKVAVVQLLGHVYMRAVDNPFLCMEAWLNAHQKGKDYDVLVVDFHAEATAEKIGMGHFLDGKASLVVGTHTHIPTADARLLNNKTAYITDVGMCGDYDSVIGMKKETAVARFTSAEKKGRLQPAESAGTFCAVCAHIDETTGAALKIFPVRLGAALENTHEL